MNKRVLIAMSGGVDSSLACYRLQKGGYQVIGATIKTWPKEECERAEQKMCCSIDAISSAKAVAHKLNIPHYVFDLSKLFKRVIRNYFTREYEVGRTPNPCIFCNSEIKFGALLKKADVLGCDYISSGHYARIVFEKKTKKFLLKKGKDKHKDQSYFLFNLKQHQLKRILFPLGSMAKPRVRQLAQQLGLKPHDRMSSQDVCFEMAKVGKRGNILFSDGSVVGEHSGITQYTIGQRRGLGIAYSEPLYVTKIDAKKNLIYVGLKSDTLRKVLIAGGINWIDRIALPARVNAKIRYGSEASPALLYPISKGNIRVEFNKTQASPTPGQAIVFYKRDVVLGGGWIKEVQGSE